MNIFLFQIINYFLNCNNIIYNIFYLKKKIAALVLQRIDEDNVSVSLYRHWHSVYDLSIHPTFIAYSEAIYYITIIKICWKKGNVLFNNVLSTFLFYGYSF